jgi:hypothetical protein
MYYLKLTALPIPTPPPPVLIANKGNVFTCHIERRKIQIEEEVSLWPCQLTGGGDGGNFNFSKQIVCVPFLFFFQGQKVQPIAFKPTPLSFPPYLRHSPPLHTFTPLLHPSPTLYTYPPFLLCIPTPLSFPPYIPTLSPSLHTPSHSLCTYSPTPSHFLHTYSTPLCILAYLYPSP